MEYKLKSAREMFEELGYECDKSCDGILYSKYIGDILYQIDFDNCNKWVKKQRIKELFEPSESAYIDIKELQAINKQIEELGW